MNELFSGVVYAGIDTDKYRYPIGKKILFFVHFCILEHHNFVHASININVDQCY